MRWSRNLNIRLYPDQEKVGFQPFTLSWAVWHRREKEVERQLDKEGDGPTERGRKRDRYRDLESVLMTGHISPQRIRRESIKGASEEVVEIQRADGRRRGRRGRNPQAAPSKV